jgi:hypothetical protein
MRKEAAPRAAATRLGAVAPIAEQVALRLCHKGVALRVGQHAPLLAGHPQRKPPIPRRHLSPRRLTPALIFVSRPRPARRLPLPACGERVGVRGRRRLAQNRGEAPSPGLLRFACNPTSPRTRGEVNHDDRPAPSPRVRGEGWGEGASPLGSESRRGPLTRIAALRLQSDLSPHAGRGQSQSNKSGRSRGNANSPPSPARKRRNKTVLAAHRLRPRLVHHAATKRKAAKLCLPRKREAERRKAHCPNNVRVKRGRALLCGGAPPFGAHACGTRHRLLPRWLGSRTGFPAALTHGRFARFAKVPRSSTLRADRSLCRSTGDPKPPGCGAASSARGHRNSLSSSRHAFRKGALNRARFVVCS